MIKAVSYTHLLVHYFLSININDQQDISQLVDQYIAENEVLSQKIATSKVNQYFICLLYTSKRDFVLKLFTKTYPQAETGFLENLSVEQYEKIFDLLIEKASLEKI